MDTEVRSALFAITADVLGQPAGPADTFFDLGADSLVVLEVAAALEGKLGLPIDAGWLMTGASLDELAKDLSARVAAGASTGRTGSEAPAT